MENTKVYTECPHCKNEIPIEITGTEILIGEEGDGNCPSCTEAIHYKISVITTKTDEAAE